MSVLEIRAIPGKRQYVIVPRPNGARSLCGGLWEVTGFGIFGRPQAKQAEVVPGYGYKADEGRIYMAKWENHYFCCAETEYYEVKSGLLHVFNGASEAREALERHRADRAWSSEAQEPSR